MNMGNATTGLLLGLTFCFLGLALGVRARQGPGTRRACSRRVVAESGGFCTLALACEGFDARHVLEGPAACLGDMPGGYCLHAACDAVACVEPDRPFAATVLRTLR